MNEKDYKIIVDTNEKILTLYLNNEVSKKYPIAIGKDKTPTPKGNYFIKNKLINPGGVYGPRWLGLSIPHYGIHGTNDPNSIGKKASKGCIRLSNENIIELYDLVSINTKVQII